MNFPKSIPEQIGSNGSEILAGAVSMAKQIMTKYPPATHCYISIGRSPALVAAYLKAKGHMVCTVPLTSFRHGVGQKDPLSVEEESDLTSHFGKYLPSPAQIGQKDIVLLEFCMHGSTAVAAYNYIHRYYKGKKDIIPQGDKFDKDNDLQSLWDYNKNTGKGIQNLKIYLAVMVGTENKKPIEDVLTSFCAADDDVIDKDLGPIYRLLPGYFTVFAPPSGKNIESYYIGSMDNEALKRFAEFGKQEDELVVLKQAYLDLVEYFKRY